VFASGKARAWLDWDEKKSEVSRIILPFQAIEIINEPRKKTMESFIPKVPLEDTYNLLIWGDNKLVMSSLMPRFAGKIDLIYIDPPFATGADFTVPVKIEDERLVKEPTAIEIKAYRDTWGCGLASYMQMMYDRLILMRQLLSDGGAIYVHLDWHVGHYVKTLMDEVFGQENFINEIIWKRSQTRSSISRRFKIAHDSILLYSKSSDYFFEVQFKELAEASKEQYSKTDEKGRPYRLVPLLVSGRRKGETGKPWRGIDPNRCGRNGMHWVTKHAKLEQYEREGLIVWAKKEGSLPNLKYYLDQTKGVPFTDIWDDIDPLPSTSDEFVGFPTQKPEDLLERIILTSSKKDDLVADFFCGSGTTLVVAEQLNRRWIGCDLSKFAVHISRKRLLEIPGCKPFQILNLGLYQKQKLMENGNGGRRYFEFIQELYGATAVHGFAYIHGRKGNRLVHIGPIDSFVSAREIRAAAREALNSGAKGIDILGWDFEMGLYDLLDSMTKEYGMDIKLKQIPLDVLEIRADERTKRLDEIRFFDLNYLDLAHEVEGREVTVIIRKFNIANPEFVPEDIRSTIKNFTSYIDFWAADFSYEGDVFHNMKQHYRTKESPELKTKISYEYEKPGVYSTLVKVVDIFGNDTNKLIPNVRVS